MTEQEKKGLNGPRKYRRKATESSTKEKAVKVSAKKKLALTVLAIPAVTSAPPKPLVEYVYKKKRIPKTNPPEFITERRVGVLYAKLNEVGKICIGFSVCHNTKDRFDYIRGMIHKPGHGVNMASERAERWADRNYYEPLPDLFDPDFNDVVRIPMMIHVQLKEFIDRCIRYYKERELPRWAVDFRNDFNLIITCK